MSKSFQKETDFQLDKDRPIKPEDEQILTECRNCGTPTDAPNRSEIDGQKIDLCNICFVLLARGVTFCFACPQNHAGFCVKFKIWYLKGKFCHHERRSGE